MVSMILRGGWMMVPILLGSIVALALVIERWWYFRSTRLDTDAFVKDLFTFVHRGEMDRAIAFCDRTTNPVAAVLRAGLEHAEEPAWDIERVMEREGQRQVEKAEKNLNFLLVIVGIEPLMGFLGTILGLIQAFMSWERYSTSVTVSALAGGIYQAMITTAAGLIVAIPYFVLYHVLANRVALTAKHLNNYGDELLSALRGRNAPRERS